MFIPPVFDLKLILFFHFAFRALFSKMLRRIKRKASEFLQKL